MTYKETLFFVAKCLTINHENEHKTAIENELKNGSVDWEAVVKVSTGHYVFPALYCNFKKANFLQYLPEDLVDYMKHITNLNRERNVEILSEAIELNSLLLTNNITPIFLKGTGNLLEGLYDDLAERMVGDIDFIFSKAAYPKAIKVLSGVGYEPVKKYKYYFPQFKHYQRIQKEGKIAAVEIHKELLNEQYADEFNYDFVKKTTQQFGEISVMSFKNQFCLSIIAKQINDDGFYYKDVTLRNAYDVFLLSKKTKAKNAFKDFQLLQNPLNCFLASCHEVFGQINSLEYEKTTQTEHYLKDFYAFLEDESLRKKSHSFTSKKLFVALRLKMIYKSIYDKELRTWLFKRVTDKQWYKEKLIQLGLKKPIIDS